MSNGRALRGSVLTLVFGGLVLPILAGAVQTLGAAFNLHAVGDRISLQPWRDMWALPGFGTSLRLSLVTGVGSTVLALLLATGLCATLHGRVSPALSNRMLTPILAVPHAALAIGFAFLIAPSGWIARLIAPLFGWQSPPDLASVNDANGVALLIGLTIKELPFLLLVILSALRQLPVTQHLSAARALGYGHGIAWIKIIMPQVWPLIRLPVLVVQAYALSAVDMAVILGPSNPPTLAVATMRWFFSPDLQMILPASAAAVIIAALTAIVCALWLFAEICGRRAGLLWLRRGGRGLPSEPLLRTASALALTALTLGLFALLAMAIWSLAFRWSFPALLPESWSLRAWVNPGAGLGRAAVASLALGVTTSVLALGLAVAWLEAEDRGGYRRAGWATGLIYLPLLLPQIGFLFGLNLVFLQLRIAPGWGAVIWAQSLFVFPYVMIALSDPWRALDPRLIRTAAALGAGPVRRLFAVKLPALLAPLLTALAIGFAVSVAQYLPTLFMGAGRIATLTTEAVTLSSGSDRRVIGAFGVLQAALPFAAYLAALVIPRVLYRNRRALLGGME